MENPIAILFVVAGAIFICLRVVNFVATKYRDYDEKARLLHEEARLAESRVWLEQHNSLARLRRRKPSSDN